MRVLMLGWEFPPHISGGLGTACLGLSMGLSHHDVELLFVVPHAFGDEDGRYVDVIGGNQVPVPLSNAAPGGQRPEGENAAGAWAELWSTLGDVSFDGPEDADRHLRVLAVDSPLTPYMTPAAYAARRGALEALGRDVDETASTGEADAGADAAARAGAGAAPDDGADEGAPGSPASLPPGHAYLPFTGAYGPDLMSEVARYAKVVAAIAERESFDVVHAHDWMTYPAGIVASRVSGKPLVAHLHASEYDRSGENVNSAVRELEQLGLSAADRVICVSHRLASQARRRYHVADDKIRVVHNAVTQRDQLADWRGTKNIDDPVVLFLGRVTFQKGPDYFLAAAARVAEVRPDVKFVVSGSGDMLPQTIDQAARLGIGRNVHFTGFLRGKDVERMYAMADIYVMPSVSEPFGISPLEAMAADVPVIVSRQSGVSEIVTNALKVDFWDVDDMANKILALLEYPALEQHLTEEGRDEVRRQRWDYRGRVVRDVYEELMA